MKLFKNIQTGMILSEEDLEKNLAVEALHLWEDDRNDFPEHYETFNAFLTQYKNEQQANYRSFEDPKLNK